MDESNAGISQVFIASRGDVMTPEWRELGVIKKDALIINDPTQYTYYMRRGHRYYFRQLGSRISMYMRNMPIKLKYGQEICLDITFKS